jgi:rubrerythrin
VRLNNIQYALLKLDALQNNINVEALAALIERHTPPAATRNEKQSYIFTIKIVSAEDLKPCDVNGLSDPYVVLSDEHGRRVAKTRTIWGDLNPRWDEVFDVPTTGSLWLAATVWDRDKLVKNHDLCGRCYVKLDPNYFGDYLPRVCTLKRKRTDSKDLWLDLDTQGKLLLRVSMEGEKDDIQFYFGRAFRALKRAENDMTRKIVDTV